jgi:hypothetical protein
MTVDTSVMPPVTETGAHTFGCLVSGWVYVGGRYYDNGGVGIYNDLNSIVFTYRSSSNTVDVRVKVEGEQDYPTNKYLKFTINNVDIAKPAPQECNFSNARFSISREDNGSDIALDNTGTVRITKITNTSDTVKIMSGVFYGTKITEGRFDVRYRTPN